MHHAERAAETELAETSAGPAHGMPEIRPIIARSLQAFRRALPELLQKKPRQWVAFHGDRLVSFGKSKTALYQECLRQGLTRGEFIVESIEPEFPSEVEILSDV